MNTSALIPGFATRAATEEYARTFGRELADGHYSEFLWAPRVLFARGSDSGEREGSYSLASSNVLNEHLKLSSLGIGTFPGAASDDVDDAYTTVVHDAALAGINVFDTAAHYRYGRSARALGRGLARAFADGVRREQVFIVGKGGFLATEGGPPENLEAWFDANVAARGLGTRADLTGLHLISPQHLDAQIDAVRNATGLETIDAFLLDQPEVHFAAIGKEKTNRKIAQVFAVFERARSEGRIRSYGISTFNGLRAETDALAFQSLAALIGLAEKAAREVHGAEAAGHGFRVVQMPFNQAMPEGFTRFSQATGRGNIASSVQAAHQLRIYVMASHTLGKGMLAQQSADAVARVLADLPNAAQRAMQFNRSTPGIGTSLVGISTPAYLAELLAVAKRSPLPRAEYLKLYERT